MYEESAKKIAQLLEDLEEVVENDINFNYWNEKYSELMDEAVYGALDDLRKAAVKLYSIVGIQQINPE